MWLYEKKLQYPVRVRECNPRLAKFLIEQYGGADGELAAALRYTHFSQKPLKRCRKSN